MSVSERLVSFESTFFNSKFLIFLFVKDKIISIGKREDENPVLVRLSLIKRISKIISLKD